MEDNNEHKEKPAKKKKRKWLRRLLFFLLTIFILFDVFLFFLATPVLKDYMQEKVLQKTQGLYRIDFDKISIELGTRRISLENFKLIPDTAVYNELLKAGVAKPAIYHISTSSVELRGTRFYKLFFKRHFKAKEFLIKNPLVILKKAPSKNEKTNKNRDFIHEDLFLSIKKHFDQIELKYIKLENGKFHLSLNKDGNKNTTHYGFISIELDHFLLNKKEFEQKSRLFYADNIQISVDDYQLKLGDGVHIMYADRLSISTKESLLKINSFGIKPAIELPQYLSRLKSNYYYISTPEIKFRNFNISDLYFDQDIEIQSIIVESPKIKLVNKLVKSKTSSKKESKEIDIYKLLKSKLKSITINTLDLNQAQFSFHYGSHLQKPSFEIDTFNVSLSSFYLDEYTKNDQSRILHSKNIRLNINNFFARLMDNTHILSTGKINLHTDTRSLSAENISLTPLNNKSPKSQLLNVKLSSLDIKGADFYTLYHNNTFTISKLTAGNSSTNIKLFKKDDKVKNKSNKVLGSLMGTFMTSLYVRSIQLNKANFKINSYLKDSLLNEIKGKINLNLQRFYVESSDSIKNNKLFNSERFKLELFNYSQFLKDHLHILKVEEVYMSNTDSLVRISKLSIKPKIKTHQELAGYNKSKLINFHIEGSEVNGIDIPEAYENKDLTIKTILITQPSLELRNYVDLQLIKDTSSIIELNKGTSQIDSLLTDSLVHKNTITSLLSDYFERIKIGNFSLWKSNFKFIDIDSLNQKDLVMSGNLSATVKGFDYDYQMNTESYGFANSENFNFELDNFYRKVSDKRYLLKIKKAKFSAKDSLFSADIIRIFPTPNVHDSMYNNLIWTIYSPKLETKGININAFLNENILDLGTIKLINPSIALTRQEKKNTLNKKTAKIDAKQSRTKNNNQNNFPFEKIITDSLIIEDGAFGILKNKFDLRNQIFNTNFNIQLGGFQLDSNIINNPIETLKEINTIIQLQNFRYLLPKNNYFIDIDKLYFNSKNGIAQIYDIGYYPQNTTIDKGNKEKTKLETLHVPMIIFNNFSFEDLLSQKLVSDTLSINKADIFLTTGNIDSNQNKNPLEINLYQKTKKIFKGINLSHIQINDASIKIRKIKEGSPNVTDYNKVYGTISNLIIDSTHQNDKDRLFNTSDIAFRINDFELDTKNELYKIKIKELGFSTGLKRVYANLISMNPTIERDALVEKAKKEIKLVYLNVNELIATEFDFRNFLSSQKIITERININDFKLHSYKNKHFPLDSIVKIALPIDYMLKARNYIKIDTVNINNSYIGVELLGANSMETGYFDITRLNGTITGLSNDKELIDNGLTTKLKARGLIMDEGLLTASFRFPLNSKYGDYFYGGKLNSMEMAAFNPLLENLFFVSIRDGIIDSMSFNISANEDYAEGKMKFGYNNLKFDIRNKKKTDSLIVAKRGFVSMAANSIIKDNNPRRKNGRLQEDRIYFERDVYHSIFHYWTLSTVSGIQSTMGFKSKQLKERLKLEKLTEKHNRISTKKKSKVKRKEKKKQYKEINKELIEEGNSH